MHELLEKLMETLAQPDEEKDGINAETVWGSEIAARLSDKGELFRIISKDGPYSTYTEILEKYKRYQLSDDEAEWVLAFMRTYIEVQERYHEKMAMELAKRDFARFVEENGGPEGMQEMFSGGDATESDGDKKEDDDGAKGLYQ
tara:strand:- start:168 stop:599 length:432 start_codon:yes stop_codon:yes gene_type:complete